MFGHAGSNPATSTMYHSRLPSGGTCPVPEKCRRHFEWYRANTRASPLFFMRLYLRYKVIVIFILALFAAGCAAKAPYLRLDSSLEGDIRVYNDLQYVPLVRLCDTYKIDCKWDSYIRTAIISKSGRIILRAGSDRILVNGNDRKLSGAVIFTNGAVFVPVSFVRNYLGLIVGAEPIEKVHKIPAYRPSGRYMIKTIVIDPGHGGRDAGAVGKKLRLKEKYLNLNLSKKLKNILEEHGIKVIMTRESDVFIPLQDRVRMANSSGADLFISIHANASRSRAMNGFECYYLSEATDDNARATEAFENASFEADEGAIAVEHPKGLDKTLWDMRLTENRRESAELATQICSAVEKNIVTRNRGTKTARFYVLKWTTIPSALVETGYISNKFEELKFKDEAYIDRFAEVIAKGILSYKDKYERTEGFTQ